MATTNTPPDSRPLTVGLVYRPSGTPGPDRSWARSLVVRHARAEGLTLLDVFELDDDRRRNGVVLRLLTRAAADAGAEILITKGLAAGLGARLADELGLRHSRVPPPGERGAAW